MYVCHGGFNSAMESALMKVRLYNNNLVPILIYMNIYIILYFLIISITYVLFIHNTSTLGWV